MNTFHKSFRVVATAAVLTAVAACASLDVSNPNAPDRTRALGEAADVSSLLSGAYYNWYFSTQDFPPSMPLGAVATHNSMSWGNWGARFYSSVPRRGFQNDPTDANSNVLTEVPWYNDYSALVSANLTITQAKDPAVFPPSNPDLTAQSKMLITAAEFIQGATLANIAMYFNQGFFVDENSTPGADVPFLSNDKIRDSALKKLDKAIADAGANTFQLPQTYLNITGWTNTQVAQVANTEAARLLTYFPRTNAQLAAMTTADWAKIAGYASKGISSGTPFNPSITGNNANWYDGYKYLGEDWDTWMRVNQRVVNELDPSQPTTYAYGCPTAGPGCTNPAPKPISADKRYDPTPVNDASAGALATKDFIYITYDNFNPARGRYHFSQVGHNRYGYHADLAADGGGFGVVPFLLAAENDLIWAEALVRQGGAANLVQAAGLINKTRVNRGQLPALTGVADVVGAGFAPLYGSTTYNATGEAQVLLRAIFYERDIELMNSSPVTPFYDARRNDRFTNFSVLVANDLKDSPRQFPVPAKELSALGAQLYTIIGTDSIAGAVSSVGVIGGGSRLGGSNSITTSDGRMAFKGGNQYVAPGQVKSIADALHKQSMEILKAKKSIF